VSDVRAAPAVPPEVLARLRTSGIRIDRDGQFWHEGEPVAHEGLRRALFRWLDRLPKNDEEGEEGGRYILRLDERRYAFVDVDDTPLVATSLRWQAGDAFLGLTDGSEERLDPTTLTIDGAGVLRCRVRDGRLEARLATSAATVLAEGVDATGAQAVLTTATGKFAIPRR
jgi:hypothetical protein